MKLLPIYIISFILFYIFLKTLVKRKEVMNFFLLAPIMGTIWESVTANYWTYDPTQFTLVYFWNQQMPIEGIFTWGIIFTSSLLLAEFVQKKLFKHWSKISFLISTILVMVLIGYIVEYTGVYFSMWSYTYATDYQIWILIVPLRVWIGWLFFGTIMLSTVKFYSTKSK